MSDVVVVATTNTATVVQGSGAISVTESDLNQAQADARYAALVHHTRHESGGLDGMAIDAAAATGSLRTLGTGAAQAAAGTHAHSGTNVAFTPAGTISATNVQAAIEEVATDAAAALAAAVAAIPDPVAMALVFGGGIL